MKVLAFDTALGALSVALCDGERVLSASFEAMQRGHAEALMSRITAVETEAGVAVQDVDRLAVTIGPGTFTGVRVGLSAARAMSLALKKPLVGVSTLAALGSQAAEPVQEVDSIAVAIDARRDQIYFQIFESNLSEMTAPAALPATKARDLMVEHRPQKGGCMVVVGSGAQLLESALNADASFRFDLSDRQPHATDIARLAMRGDAPDRKSAVAPLYLRPPDAKPQKRSSFVERQSII